MIEIEYGDIEIVNDLIQEETVNIEDIVIEFEDDLQLIEETYQPYDAFLKKYNYDPATNTIVINGRRANAGKIGSKKERNRINAFLRRNNFDPETGTIEIPTDDIRHPTKRVPFNPGVVINPGNYAANFAIGSTVTPVLDSVTVATKLKKQHPGMHYNPDGTISIDQAYMLKPDGSPYEGDFRPTKRTTDISLSKRTMLSKPRKSDQTLKHEVGHVNQRYRAAKRGGDASPDDYESLNYPEDSSDFHDVARMMQNVNDQEYEQIDDSHYNPIEFDADAFAFKHHMDPNYSGQSLTGELMSYGTNDRRSQRKLFKRRLKEQAKSLKPGEKASLQTSPPDRSGGTRDVIKFVNELNADSRELTIRAAKLNNYFHNGNTDEFYIPKKFIQLDPNNHSTYKPYYESIYYVIEKFLNELLVKIKKDGSEKIKAWKLMIPFIRHLCQYISLLYILIKTCGIDTTLIRTPYDLETRARQLQYAYLNYQKHTQNQENQANQRKLTVSQLEQQIASGQLTPDQVNKAKKKIQSIKQYEAGLEQQSQPTQQQDQGWDGKSPLPQGQELSKTQKKKMKQKKREEEYLALGKHVNDQMEEYRRMKAGRQAALDRSTKVAPTESTTPK